MAQWVEVQKEDGVALVTILNPPMNVLNQGVAAALVSTFQSLAADGDVIAVVLCGSGERAFMAGADIKEFPSALGQVGVAYALAQRFHELMNAIDFFPKPTIAALQGFVFGGGLELALTCDLRICDEETQLGVPEIKLGIFPGAGGTQRLPRLIGEARAKELMYTGEAIFAAAAERMGLVNRVVAKGESKNAALALAKTIAKRSLPALARIKRAVDEGAELALAEAVQLEARLFDEAFQTEDSREGVTAFIEKREARVLHR